MKILLINQFFWPDSAATSQLLTDLARALSERGHEVEVLCGSSGYAKADESGKPDVRIRRSRTLPFVRGRAGRILSYASFFATAGWLGLFTSKPDIVVTLTTPPLAGLLGTMLKLTRDCKHFSWEMDLYPDILCDLEYASKDNLLIKAIGALGDWSRNRATGVIALGDCMRMRLIDRGIPGAKVRVAENWADGDTLRPLPFRNDGQLNILYSGNLGLGHEVKTICAAISDLRTENGIHFTFAGGGAKRAELERFCLPGDIKKNVTFRGYCQREKLNESLAEGDIGLVSQNANCIGSMVPSKVYGIMAAGRPILFIGPRKATAATLIERFGCGWHIECGDSANLTSLLRNLRANPSEIEEAGARARQAFLMNYNMNVGISRLCSILFEEKPAAEEIRTLPGAAKLVTASLGEESTLNKPVMTLKVEKG